MKLDVVGSMAWHHDKSKGAFGTFHFRKDFSLWRSYFWELTLWGFPQCTLQADWWCFKGGKKTSCPNFVLVSGTSQSIWSVMCQQNSKGA